MSEDFFDSILPPVKMMTEPPHKEAPLVSLPSSLSSSLSLSQSSSLSQTLTKPSSTDIEKLWEEIYTSDDPVKNDNHQSISGAAIANNSSGSKIISLNKGSLLQQQLPAGLAGMAGMGNGGAGGKVFIMSGGPIGGAIQGIGGGSKRKAQFPIDQPAKEMRMAPGNESRRIFQAALQSRSIIGMGNATQQQQILAGGSDNQQQQQEEEADEEAEAHTEVYSQYQPLKLRKGKVHPYPVVESSSLSSVEVPNIRYNLSLPPEIINEARLSNVQLEAVIYGCQRHEEILPTGERAGYLIGDGAGVGKGRTLAAIIHENYILRRKRSVWISVSNDLKHDAERDLRDLGADIDIHALNKMRYAKINSPENGNVKKGVLFSTYASLIGECQNMSKSKYKTRFRQIVQWFGTDYDGVIVFDECHKAKNLMPQGSQKKTKTAEIVLKLQETLPQARVVYASATGASEPRNMAYMTRLGLWGPGTPFKRFDDFVEKLEDKVGAMELVAVDMKQRGMYIARQLSFANVTFRVHEVRLAHVQIGEHVFMDVYNESVALWTRIFEQMNACLGNKFVAKKHAKTIWGQYWAAHQRFFKYLCMAGKVQECVQITINAISQQKCVVIGLQSTGEAKTNEMLEDYGGEVTEFVSCAKGILHSFVERFFPTEENLSQMEKREDKTKLNQNNKTGRKKMGSKKPISLQDALGRHFLEKVTEDDELSSDASSRLSGSEDSEASLSERSTRKRKLKVAKDDGSDLEDEDVEILMDDFSRRYDDNSMKAGADVSSRMIQRELLDAIERLAPKLPINTLDDLIRELGGPDYVAEMSGRKGRMVMDVNTCEVSYQPRREEDVTLEQVNMVEKERFNTCQKLVAIISDAASTGISLHADKRYENSLQRVHITLELPWSADRAIQQFGRTHRSNQLYPPEYVFLISDLAGERRFASTVAKRLESLGALTHGDRRATETRDLSQFNIDNKFGRRALDHIFDTAFKGRASLVPMPAGVDLQAAFDSVGLLPKDGKNVSKFLNRILGMRLEVQNALFQYYTDTMDELIRQAKRNQEFDRGIIDLAKEDDNIFVEETQDFRMTFLGDDIKVQLHRVKNITGLSWRSAMEVPRGGNNSLDGFYVTRNEAQRKILLAVQKKDRHGTWFNVFSPNIGEQSNMIEIKALNDGYKKATLEDAERIWNEIYSITENRCLHYYWYKQCNYSRNCDTGCRSKIRYVLSGSIFYIWDIISTIHKSPQLARVRLNDGSKIIGCIINPAHKERITEILANRESQPQQKELATPSGRQSQLQKDRPAMQRPIRPNMQAKLSSQDQFYVDQNLKNVTQGHRLVASPGLRYAPAQTAVLPQHPLVQRKQMIFSSGIIPQHHQQQQQNQHNQQQQQQQQPAHIRLVPIHNQRAIAMSPGLRIASHPAGIRLVHPQSAIHATTASSSSPQIFSTGRPSKAVELPSSYIEFTE